MNSPPVCITDAVPRRTILPPEVIGLVVPGRRPAIAVVRFPLDYPVTGLFVPGRANPDIGLPELETGLTF